MKQRILRHSAALVPCLLSGAVLLAQATTEPTPPSQAAPLAYAPEQGALFEVQERVERVTETAGRPAVTDTRERTSRVFVTCTDTGFLNTAHVVSQSLSRNGSPVASPVLAAMEGLTFTYDLDKEGALRQITGYEMLPEAMRAKLADGIGATLGRMLNLDSLARQDAEAYGRVYEGLRGEVFEVGAAKLSAAARDLPYGGQAIVYAIDVLSPWDETDGTARVTTSYSTDPAMLAAGFETVEEASLRAAAEGLAPALPENHVSASVSGSGESVVDPSGLLVASRTVTLEFDLIVNDRQGVPVQYMIRETREFGATPVEPEGTPEPPQS